MPADGSSAVFVVLNTMNCNNDALPRTTSNIIKVLLTCAIIVSRTLAFSPSIHRIRYYDGRGIHDNGGVGVGGSVPCDRYPRTPHRRHYEPVIPSLRASSSSSSRTASSGGEQRDDDSNRVGDAADASENEAMTANAENVDYDDELFYLDESEEHDYDNFRALEDEVLLELLGRLPDDDLANATDADFGELLDNDELSSLLLSLERGDGVDDTTAAAAETTTTSSSSSSQMKSEFLERALLEGVVPAEAGVGSKCLPGDYGFDPLNLSTKDYFKQTQRFIVNFLPGGGDEDDNDIVVATPRPPALILRDYREAEIRHGRLAMLASVIWPVQEILDRIVIPDAAAGSSIVYGGTTLPFLSLLMTLVMMLLGYLDIYAKVIKEEDSGEAFLPGECFWDPLSILAGAPDEMKRNFQRRELNLGRVAMAVVAVYFLEEVVSKTAIVDLAFNKYLFYPVFEIPEIREWLDNEFGVGPSPVFVDVMKETTDL
mmetsp:Transcript_32893/g.40395  ORF Transcript_32893/g.40395 Transcript_32893/m.40395 type:complete len:486 (-) Transcript_32893:227-1684(-)